MTGTGFRHAFETAIGEAGSGFYDDVRLNNLIATANVNIIDRKIQEFQSTEKITIELEPLIVKTSAIVPVNATVDISPTSAAVTNFYSFGNLLVNAPYGSLSVSNYAKERPVAQFQSSYTAGNYMYPRYYFTNGLLNIEPANATSVVLMYFVKPFVIDVADNTIPIPYNDKLINLIISETMIQAGVSSRDNADVIQGTMLEQRNP